jgi:hypothetical protein
MSGKTVGAGTRRELGGVWESGDGIMSKIQIAVLFFSLGILAMFGVGGHYNNIPKQKCVHQWSKWENIGEPFVNGLGMVVVKQGRYCTNCNFFQGAINP